jgi:hypothetical protein
MKNKHWLILCATFLYIRGAQSQTEWELKKDKGGIKIYSRSAENSKFNELRAVFDLKGRPEKLKSILEDVPHYRDWVYSTKTSELIEQKDKNAFVYYAEVSAPWPVSNRDYYSETSIICDSVAGTLQIKSRNIPNRFPTRKHLVRVPFLNAEWSISRSADNTLHVEYQLRWDPGGSVPPWLVNLFASTGPYESFSLLKKKMTDNP